MCGEDFLVVMFNKKMRGLRVKRKAPASNDGQSLQFRHRKENFMVSGDDVLSTGFRCTRLAFKQLKEKAVI